MGKKKRVRHKDIWTFNKETVNITALSKIYASLRSVCIQIWTYIYSLI